MPSTTAIFRTPVPKISPTADFALKGHYYGSVHRSFVESQSASFTFRPLGLSQSLNSGVRVGGGGGRGAIPPTLFPTPKKVRGCQILNIVIVVRLVIKNLEESDCLVVVNIKKT